MPVHDDHRDRAGDDAHVLSLRLALGTILSPKRPQMTRSSTTTSGSVSPAVHCSYSAIPMSPSHSNSASHPAPTPTPHSHPIPHPNAQAHRLDHHQPAVNALDEPHPLVPDAVVGAPSLPAGVTIPGNMTPSARAHFLETLQSKKSWDALIHGSWV